MNNEFKQKYKRKENKVSLSMFKFAE